MKTIIGHRDTITGYDFKIDKALTPVKAMRAKCMECMCQQATEVRNCDMSDCTLWPYRMGRSPGRQGRGGKKSGGE